ncbi:MAG: hypothetical protein NTV22_17900 [bacterium]|nr:hypothetical protein [bacterium]
MRNCCTTRRGGWAVPALALALCSAGWCAAAGLELFVAPTGAVYTTIQAALDAARAGDTVTVRAGTYPERLSFSHGGDATNGRLVLRALPGAAVQVNGRNQSSSTAPHLISIYEKSYISICGLRICSNRATSANGGSGIFIEGACAAISLCSNELYWLRGTHGMGITVYGTQSLPCTNIQIIGNIIRDSEPATSEALTLNGNVCGFQVIGNLISNVNNIGICMIGGEADIHPSLGARHGICFANRVIQARSSYGGGYAAGIYADGGHNIVIAGNYVTGSDVGMELGAENPGWRASNIVAHSNLLVLNDKIGLGLGGYAADRGRVSHCRIDNNTFFCNNVLGLGSSAFHGEMVVQFGEGNEWKNNLVIVSPAGDRRALLDAAESGNVSNDFDYNLYYCSAGQPRFDWHGVVYTTFAGYTNAPAGGDRHSRNENPAVVSLTLPDLHLTAASAAIGRGDPTVVFPLDACDFDGNPRSSGGQLDVGAFAYVPEPAWLAAAIALVTCLRALTSHRQMRYY